MAYNNSTEVYSPVTRCAYKFYNADSRLDKTAMTVSYWNGLLKLSISPIIVKDDGSAKVDGERHTDIYLSPSKAVMFNHAFNMIKSGSSHSNAGVNTNKGIIYVASGESMNTDNVCIIIALLDENGNKKSEAAYEFNSNTFFITDYMGGTDFKKDTSYKAIELDIFSKILNTFIESSTNAMAASVVEANKYTSDREYNFMKDVRSKLGIEIQSSSNHVRSNNSSFFNNNGSVYSGDGAKNNNTVDSYDDIISDVASIMD